jgi:undecaprenyl-diphosphatase
MLDAIITWDEWLFRLSNGDWRSPLFDTLFPLVTNWHNFAIPFLLAALLLITLGRWRGLRFVVLALVSVMVADALSAHLVKSLVGRARPCNALEGVKILVGCTMSSSFPSNHAANASVLATLAILYARSLLLPAAAVAMLVAYSRVYVGVHYPLDILAGGVLGIAVALALSGIMTATIRFLQIREEAPPTDRRHLHRFEMGER